MAELRDLLGRISTLDTTIEGMTRNVMKASNAMGKAIKLMKESSDGNSAEGISEAVQRLTDALSGIVPDLRDQVEQGKDVVKAIEEFKKSNEEERSKRQKSEAESLKGEEKMMKVMENLNSSIKELTKKVLGPTEQLSMVSPEPKGTGNRTGTVGGGGGGGRGGGGGGGLGPLVPDGDDFNKNMDRIGREGAEALSMGLKYESKKQLASWMTGISTALMGGRGDLFQTLFSGSVRDVTQFREEARLLAFELEGMNKSTRGMQADFADLGKVAKQTGKSVDVMQRVFLRNMQKGFKGQGDLLKKTLKSGLQLSTMIGSETDATAEIFSDWSRMLGMSSDQMSQMAMDAKNIARSTGVTGDELLGAMRSSEALLKNLRNQGNLTSSAARNVVEAMAEAKKFGIDDKFGQLADMMTSTNKFMEGDSKTRSFIQRMGGTDAALKGKGMDDKENLRRMAANMDETIRNFTLGKASGVEGIKGLSDDDRMVLARQLSLNFGMEIYEFENIFKILEKDSKTLGEQFRELSDAAANENESAEKRALAEQKMTELMADTGMTFANKFVEIARKDGKNISDALNEASAAMNEGERKDMQSLLAKAELDPGALAQADAFGAGSEQIKAMLVAAKAMSERGKELGMDVKDLGPEILKAAEKASKTGESGDLVALIDKMQETGREIDVKAKTDVTPMESLSQEINKLNETIRGLASGPLGMLIDTLGWVGLALGQVALQAGMLYVLLPGAVANFAIRFRELAGQLGGLGKRMDGLGDSLGGLSGGLFNKLIGHKRMRTVPGATPGSYKFQWDSNIFSRMADRFADFFENIGNKGFRGLWKNITGGFSFVINKIWSGVKWIGSSISNLFKKISFKGLFNKITDMFKGAEGTKGIGSFISNIRTMVKAAWSGGNVFKMLGGMFRALSKAARANPVGFFLFAAIDGVMGAVEGYRSAAKIFGVETKELTMGMKVSAGAAGGLVGILDGLTFGLLRMTGVARPLEEIFANVIYGFMWMGEGIKNGFMSWMPNVIGSFEWLGEAVGDLFGQIASIFGFDAQTTGQKWDAFFKIMENVGWFIGNVLGGTLNAIVMTLWVVVKAVQAVVWVFQVLFKVISSIGSFIANIFVGAFKLMFDAIYNISSIGSVIKNAWDGVVNWFTSLPSRLFDGMLSLMPNWAKRLLGIGGSAESNTPASVATPQVALADGGITTGPTTALIGEAGPEAVIPLDKLDGMMSQNKVLSTDFSKEKSLAEQKKLSQISKDSSDSLKNLDRMASASSEGLYVRDVKTHTMLQLLFTQLGYIYESVEAGLNFMSQGQEEKMKMARADAKLNRLDTTSKIAEKYVEKGLAKEMKEDLMLAYKQSLTGVATKGIKSETFTENYGKKFSELESKEIIDLMKKIEEYSEGTRNAVAHGEKRGSFYTHDVHMVGEVGDLTSTIEEKIPDPLKQKKPEVSKAVGAEPDYRHKIPDPVPVVDSNKQFITSPSVPTKGSLEHYRYRAVADSGNFEQNYQTMPEHMWSSRDHVDSRMERQANMYAASPNFETSAQMASVEGLEENLGRNSIEYGDGQSMGLEEAMEKLRGGLESKAKSRVIEENKEVIAAMDTNIKKLEKEYLSESSKSIDEVMAAKAKKRKFLDDNMDKYYLEDSVMASKPGEDPSMLYESYSAAKERTVGMYQKNAKTERALVAAQEQELARLKDKRKEVRGRRRWGGWAMGIDPDKDEIGSIDKRIAEIEGTKDFWGRQKNIGSLEISKSRLEMWEKNIEDPSVINRKSIGQNVWTGNSDTSTVFPKEMSAEAIDYAFDTREQVEINPGNIQETSIPPSEAMQKNLESIESLKSPVEGPAAEAVLEQNMEQTKKLGTVEEASARSLEPGSIYTHDIHLEKLLSGLDGDRLSLAASTTAAAIDSASAYHATPVGQHAIPVMREEEESVSQVQPVHLRDIAESILKDKVSGDAGTGKLQSDELARMEEIANRQYAEMQQIREGIQEMVSLLKPSGDIVGGGVGESPKTKFAREHVRPTVYGQMIDGKPGGGANRSVYKDF